ncbi:hypothetical protein MLD38_033039 [Melastoma candidum]|uniref:Uncharacterized protein n=1 Tax=Melastoma candidum TaxID=119954 RepID=A0ACB9M7J9_9MYRT|nr:hypothetical protein MLD38_033039 [Melastoma candidum]
MVGSGCASIPHVLVFPFPVHSHGRMDASEGVRGRFARYQGFRFETVTDGLPRDHPRCGERVREMFHSTRTATLPAFREMILSGRLGSASGGLVTCIIADGVMSFSVDVAKEIGVPCFLFRTVSAACFWAYFSIPRLIDTGVIPFKPVDLDEPISAIPAMEGFLRRRDIPSFCRSHEITMESLEFISAENQHNSKADAMIFNTFEELESPVLSHIRQDLQKGTRERAEKLAGVAASSCKVGGESYHSLEKLIEDVKDTVRGAYVRGP